MIKELIGYATFSFKVKEDPARTKLQYGRGITTISTRVLSKLKCGLKSS